MQERRTQSISIIFRLRRTPQSRYNSTGEPSRLIYFSFATLTSVSYVTLSIHRFARPGDGRSTHRQLYPAILIATSLG